MMHNGNRIPYLEGIRGIAALMVVVNHLLLTFDFHQSLLTPNQENFSGGAYFIHRAGQILLRTASDGNFAVYIFWFMSAFVISLSAFQNPKFSFFRSIGRRYIRLALPALASVLFAYLLLMFGVLKNQEFSQMVYSSQETWAGGLFGFESRLIFALKDGLFDTFFNFSYDTSYNTALWTMGPELLGSWMCFAIIAIFKKYNLRLVSYGILFIASCLTGYYWGASFIAGCFLSDIVAHNKMLHFKDNTIVKNKTVAFLVPLFFVTILVMQGYFVVYSGLRNMIFSIASIVFIMQSKFLQKFFSSKIPVWFGKISFGLYLIHIPIIASLGCGLSIHHYPLSVTTILLISFATLMISIFTGYVFTICIDKPSLKFSRKV